MEIFAPYERAGSTRNGGLGLGLYIARENAAVHGGSIRALLGEGATFVVELPIAM